MKNRSFTVRLGFALSGVRTVWQRERSFRAQVAIAMAAVFVLATWRPGLLWAALVILAIALVLALEMLNSALEYLIDHVHPELAVEIGHAKDAAAGAVLIASVAAVAVGSAMLLSTA